MPCYIAVSILTPNGRRVDYEDIDDLIMGVQGVVTHGLFLENIKAAVVADGPEAKILEKVHPCPCSSSIKFSVFADLHELLHDKNQVQVIKDNSDLSSVQNCSHVSRLLPSAGPSSWIQG